MIDNDMPHYFFKAVSVIVTDVCTAVHGLFHRNDGLAPASCFSRDRGRYLIVLKKFAENNNAFNDIKVDKVENKSFSVIIAVAYIKAGICLIYKQGIAFFRRVFIKLFDIFKGSNVKSLWDTNCNNFSAVKL